jgi:hypothetical protein
MAWIEEREVVAHMSRIVAKENYASKNKCTMLSHNEYSFPENKTKERKDVVMLDG